MTIVDLIWAASTLVIIATFGIVVLWFASRIDE